MPERHERSRRVTDRAKVFLGLTWIYFFIYFFYCVESMLPLLPSGAQTQVHLLVPSRKFDLSYDLNFATICTDFQENIEFRFSLGWKSLVHRFLGSANAQRALKMMDQNLQSQVGWREGALCPDRSCPRLTPLLSPQPARPALAATPNCGPASAAAPSDNEAALVTQEDLMMLVATNVASLTSRASMSAVIVVGVVRCLGSPADPATARRRPTRLFFFFLLGVPGSRLEDDRAVGLHVRFSVPVREADVDHEGQRASPQAPVCGLRQREAAVHHQLHQCKL